MAKGTSPAAARSKGAAKVAPTTGTIVQLTPDQFPKSHPLCGKQVRWAVSADEKTGRKAKTGKCKMDAGDSVVVLLSGKWYFLSSLSTLEKV